MNVCFLDETAQGVVTVPQFIMIRNASDSASRRFVWAIFGIGVIVSVVLSIWSIAIDSGINNDGIEYVRAAELLSSGDWQAAFTVY